MTAQIIPFRQPDPDPPATKLEHIREDYGGPEVTSRTKLLVKLFFLAGYSAAFYLILKSAIGGTP